MSVETVLVSLLHRQVRVPLASSLPDAVERSWERSPVDARVAVHADLAYDGLPRPREHESGHFRRRAEVAGIDHLHTGARRERLKVTPDAVEEHAGRQKP